MKHLCFVIVIIAVFPMSLHAHRVVLTYKTEGKDLLIQGWLGADEHVKEGEVRIAAEDGTILATGETNDQGIFCWTPDKIQSISIDIYAGKGHKGSAGISSEELTQLFAAAEEASQTIIDDNTKASATKQAKEVESATKEKDASNVQPNPYFSSANAFGTAERVILGLVFIFAAASAWLSYRNSKRLKSLEEAITQRESRH